ncbi:arginine repressor [Ligilactobacillus sp. WILCCON 0076]|uniref:Arginine repressor n=1 Tax=Ligilactobacillus ubinensis TaxID=2876789 RepID=A0A9X2JLM5_9LACO|nr:arginine repressor [Ligilactobacillus ubinensis]MCP0886755.1 arginine repressor [Ligilactobacillus ubinensis]
MKKEQRQAKIEQLIKQNLISTQDDLMRRLEESGIKATQATISRDIRDMKIIKEQDGNGNLHYVIFKANNQTEEERLYKTIYDTVKSLTQVEFMNVIHTMPRNANVLAAILDDLVQPQIVGTLAGYDTVIIISGSKSDASSVNELFRIHMNEDNLI